MLFGIKPRLPETDIHCHLLPGVDDGFRKAEDSLAALSKMAAAGVRKVVFMPHLNPDVYPEGSEEKMRAAYAEFSKMIPSSLGIETSLAAEYMVVKDFEERAEDPSLLVYPDGSILIEMSYFFASANLEKTIFNLVMAGKKPILAHPERYLYLASNLKAFDNYKEMGCRFQMNLMSAAGAYGPESMKILKYLRERGWYDFAATDLHSLPQLDSILSHLSHRKTAKLLPY